MDHEADPTIDPIKHASVIRDLKRIEGRKWFSAPFGAGAIPTSVGDAARGALVDASTAVDALAGVDDCDVLAGDCSFGADVNACSACDTLRSVYASCHFNDLWNRKPMIVYKSSMG